MIASSERHAEHPLAGQNTQQRQIMDKLTFAKNSVFPFIANRQENDSQSPVLPERLTQK